MRRARRADLALIWPATLQTVWDDLPEDERAGLDRRTWENHFRKKIEAFVEGNRTERWIAEGPSGETLGYVILGESGFLTPETHALDRKSTRLNSSHVKISYDGFCMKKKKAR